MLSCSKTSSDAGNIAEGREIIFSTSISTAAVPAKSFLYDESNIIDSEGHGNFSVVTYMTGSSDRFYTDTDRVYWFQDAAEWRFYHNDGQGEYFYERYWPTGSGLDFFAYMPYDLDGCHTSLGNYIDGKGPTFSCDLPTDKDGQDSASEFVYAFATGQTYETGNGNVSLNFIHPYSAVRFRLGKAHGNTTINSVGFNGIHTSGSFTVSPDKATQTSLVPGDWTNKGVKKPMNITIGKTVPDQQQLESEMGGPYIVMPQTLEGVKITVDYDWNGNVKAEVELDSDASWIPGKIYTYTLHLGDNQEDVTADVSVEPWAGDYRTDISVE